MTCAKSNNLYLSAQSSAYLCWIKTQSTFHAKWWSFFAFYKQPPRPEYGVQKRRANVDIRVLSVNLQPICSKYRHETWLAPSTLALIINTICAENCLETLRVTSDVVRIFRYDIRLNCAENVLNLTSSNSRKSFLVLDIQPIYDK